MFNGVEHTAIASPDPERLAQWYADHLEFAIVQRLPGKLFLKARNGSMIEIVIAQGERARESVRSPGLRHLAIDVDDFDAACRQLEAGGVKLFSPPYELDGVLLAFFDDPDGNILHLSCRREPL